MKLVISDTHIGDKHADHNLPKLFKTLEDHCRQVDQLILNGDIFDLAKTLEIDNRHREFLSILQKYKQVEYIVGNHDWLLRGLHGVIPGITMRSQLIQDIGPNRIFFMHGHQGDMMSNIAPGFARFLVKLNKWIDNKIHIDIQRTLKETWIVQKLLLSKQEKRIIKRVEDICDVLVAGHTHMACDRMEKRLRYINTGDWVDHNCAYLLIDGANLELVKV